MTKVTLKAAREAKGFTQDQMAKKLHISKSGYQRKESKQRILKPSELFACAKILGVDPERLDFKG